MKRTPVVTLTLDDVRALPVETDPEKRLLRSRQMQSMLSSMAVEAAEIFWPGFLELCTEAVLEERRLLLRTQGKAEA